MKCYYKVFKKIKKSVHVFTIFITFIYFALPRYALVPRKGYEGISTGL